MIYKKSGNNLAVLYSYQLSNIIITSVLNNWTGGAADDVTETVTINVSKFRQY